MARTLEFRPDVEGLRAIAVLLVVGFHGGIPGLSGGFIGVDVFFVISGYLISGLFVEEMKTKGSIDILRFYARRIRRLIPAATLMILTTLIFGAYLLSPVQYNELSKSALAAAVSASNIWFLMNSADYFGVDMSSNPMLHTWSLAVEEQFYIVWPLIFLLFFRGASKHYRIIITILLLSLGSLVACIIVTETRQPWAFFGTPLRAWEFGVGALVYILPRHQRLETDLWYRSISWIGMALVVLSGLLLVEGDAFPGALAIPAVIGTGLMLRASGFDSGTVGRFLSIGPMQFLGRLSYSWYLWHWPVLTLADSLQPGPLALGPSLICLAISLALSAVTFVLVEDPIRRHRALVPRSLATIGLGAILISVGAGTSYGSYSWAKRTLDSPSQREITFARQDVPGSRECVAKYADTEPIVCEFGPSTGRETLVLFGDSHAHQWLPAFQRLASENDLKLLTFLKSACPTAMTPAFYYPALKRAYHECVTWRDRAL